MSIISKDVAKAVSLLKQEELVAIPTETVYGLAGNIFSSTAINAIFKTKARPFFNPLIVHISSIQYLDTIASAVPKKAKLLAEAFWPGPLTLVLPKQSHIPDLITAGKPTVAVRIPNHPLTLELLRQLDFPLAAPSANPFTSISPTSAKHVEQYFKDKIKMVLDGGNCESGIESTIIGFEDQVPVIYRLGSTPLEAIEAVVGKLDLKHYTKNPPDAPGMLARHYAPKTLSLMSNNLNASIEQYKGKRIGVLAFREVPEDDAVTFKIILSAKGSLEEAGKNLYDALHQLDREKLDVIIVESLPNYGLGKSINDRLTRATTRKN